MPVLYANNAASRLSASITNTATSFSVTSGTGALFPAITGGDYFYATLMDSAGNLEIVRVTARATDTFTVTRAQEGTTARAYAVNDIVELRITKAMLDDLKGERLALAGGTVTGPTTFNSSILFNGGVGGGEGGEVSFSKPATTSLAGNVVLDIQTNSVRFYEAGGTFRGASLDLTGCAGGAGSILVHSSNVGTYAATLGTAQTITGLKTFSGGAILGNTVYPNYAAVIDFSEVAGTWKRIAQVTSPNQQYSTIGFRVVVLDPQGNHMHTGAVDAMRSEIYDVACVRTNDTVLDTPDACYVRGPSNRIRAVKTATGTYEIQIQNAAQYREYRVDIRVIAFNGSHTVAYFAGDTAAAGTAQYNASVSTTATDFFQNISARQLTSSVATGTAPLVVTSTTRVANLNVATAGNADTVTNGVYTTGDQTINGLKAFPTAILPSNGSYLSGSAYFGSGAWRNYNPNQNGWAIRNTGGIFTLFAGTSNSAAAAGTAFTDFQERFRIDNSGNVTATGTVTSTVATGAAPFAVTSTTRVANLNVATAGTADTLTTARTINGASFNGSANITTTSWGTARTLTIGSTGKSVDGSAAVSWTLAEVTGTTAAPQFGSVGVGTAASGTTGEIRATNNITAYFSSDRKWKENIRPIENALDVVEAVGGKLFDWTDEYITERGGEDGYFVRKEDFGVVAQDLRDVFPLAVRERPDGSLAVDYEKLCALAFAAISELRREVRAQ